MPAICPVLLVGTGDFSEIRTLLRAHGIGTVVAPTCEAARLMLRHFQVDAIVAVDTEPLELAPLADLRTPLVVVGGSPGATRDALCAAVVSSADPSALPGIVLRVIRGERGRAETRGAA